MQIQKEYRQITSQANQKGNAYAKPNSCKTTQNMHACVCYVSVIYLYSFIMLMLFVNIHVICR